jgi:hypothetical protein
MTPATIDTCARPIIDHWTVRFAGDSCCPSSLDALDAFLTPLTLLKASLAGIPVPLIVWSTTLSRSRRPALVLAINAFQTKYRRGERFADARDRGRGALASPSAPS